MDDLVAAARELLKKNTRAVSGRVFTIPSPSEYCHQWLWDSCFHAMVWRHFDTARAEQELLSMLSFQRADGRLPHEGNYSFLGMRLPFVSRITQPPFPARAAFAVYEKGRNREFLASVFPALHRYHQWLERAREADGILNVVNPNESGEDNSVLWDHLMPLPLHRLYGFFSAYLPLPQMPALRSVTQTSVYADAVDAMAAIARVLKNKQRRYYEAKHRKVIAALRQFRHDGNYYSLSWKKQPLMLRTHDLFSPLFAGAVPKKEAKGLVENHLLDSKQFWTSFPIPTVAVSERKFAPRGYWRGPAWVNINWMLFLALKRYGYADEAAAIKEKTTAMILKAGFCEYYNPLTGKGLGARMFSWSTLIVDMMEN